MAALQEAVTSSMKSFTDFLKSGAEKLVDASSALTDFVDPVLLVFLYTVLFVHFFAFALENNTKITEKWPALTQSMHELRMFIGSYVLGSTGQVNGAGGGLVYWGSFALAASASATSRGVRNDVMNAMFVGTFFAIVWVLNQICMMATMTPFSQGAPFYPDGSHSLDSPGYYPNPLFSKTKFKPTWVVVEWLRTVTTIILYNAVKGVTYGYGAGKIVALLTGNNSLLGGEFELPLA